MIIDNNTEIQHVLLILINISSIYICIYQQSKVKCLKMIKEKTIITTETNRIDL